MATAEDFDPIETQLILLIARERGIRPPLLTP